MEYYCHYCREWQDPAYCESHFESVHGQKKVTFEALKTRLSTIGGLETREVDPEAIEEEPTEKPPKSWMWRDDVDPNAPIITNNFRHNV
jgi:hypothetical protein